mgnify:CR=1 FL=1
MAGNVEEIDREETPLPPRTIEGGARRGKRGDSVSFVRVVVFPCRKVPMLHKKFKIRIK